MKRTRVPLSIGILLVLNSLGPAQALEDQVPQPAPPATEITEWTTTLPPGVWHSRPLGASSLQCVYGPEISSLKPLVDGAHIWRCFVQPEFDGVRWNDVLRVMIPAHDPPLDVPIRVSILLSESLHMPAVLKEDQTSRQR